MAHEASTSNTKVISKLTIIFVSYGKSPSSNQSGEVLAELVTFNCLVDLVFYCQAQFRWHGKAYLELLHLHQD